MSARVAHSTRRVDSRASGRLHTKWLLAGTRSAVDEIIRSWTIREEMWLKRHPTLKRRSSARVDALPNISRLGLFRISCQTLRTGRLQPHACTDVSMGYGSPHRPRLSKEVRENVQSEGKHRSRWKCLPKLRESAACSRYA